MSDKSRGYSDANVTIIFKGSSVAEVQALIDDANSLAPELKRAAEQIAKLEEQLAAERELTATYRNALGEENAARAVAPAYVCNPEE